MPDRAVPVPDRADPAPAAGPVPAVYFLSDYGTADEFVGVVHAVLHTEAPGVAVVDLGHQIPPFDVAAGAAMLVRCAPYLGPGVVLAVVDPGVGGHRRGVAIETSGPGPGWLVGPDNGLLLPLAEALGGPRGVLVLDSERAEGGSTRAMGRTFDGRDLFAPATAHLVRGSRPGDLGSATDPASLVPAASPPAPRSAARTGEAGVGPIGTGGAAGLDVVVTWVDRFGNVQLGADARDLDAIGVTSGGRARVALPGPPARSEPARRVFAFADLAPDELGLLVDSSGHVALVYGQASAADRLGPVSAHDTVRITAEPHA